MQGCSVPACWPIPKESEINGSVQQPWAYLSCGHIHGYHEWKVNDKETRDNRTYPICRKVNKPLPLTQLLKLVDFDLLPLYILVPILYIYYYYY